MRTIAFDAEITKTGEISALSVVDDRAAKSYACAPIDHRCSRPSRQY